MKLKSITHAFMVFSVFAPQANASLTITTLNSAQIITFDSSLAGVNEGQFAGSGFQSSPTTGQLDSNAWAVTGWSDGALAFDGTRTTAATDYTRGATTTAVTTGGIYAHGSTDRQLLIQPGGGDWAPGTMTLRILNSTGFSVDAWTVSYDLFVRNDQGRSNSFNFSYSTDGTTFINTGLTDPLFTFTSTAVAVASDALNLIGTPSATINPTVADGGFLFLRWSGADAGGTGSRDEFALDNISIAAIPEPSRALLLGIGSLGLIFRRRRQ